MSNSHRQDSNAVSDDTEVVHRARHLAGVVSRKATALRNWDQVPLSGMIGTFPEDRARQRASQNDLSGPPRNRSLNRQSGQASAGARIHRRSR